MTSDTNPRANTLLQMVRLGANQLVNQSLQPISRGTGFMVNRPTSVFMEITSECFMRCQMCDMWQNQDDPKALSTEDKQSLLQELRHWLGPFRLNLTGGEPFMKRKQLFTLTRYCSDHAIMTSTNTAALAITDRIADEVLDSGLTELLISLDSLTRETHDTLRGRPGTFDRIMQVIRYLNQKPRQLRLGTRAIINRHNLKELIPMVTWAEEVGLDSVGFHPLESKAAFGAHVPFEDSWYEHDDLWPRDTGLLQEVLDELIALKEQGKPIDTAADHLRQIKQYYTAPNSIGVERNCFTGVKNLIISSQGEVRLCFIMPPIGNVRHRPIRDLWTSHEAAERRAIIKSCTQNCSVIACNRRYSLRAQIKPFVQRVWA
jgi:MoaA/NifB/PqqE/SkfB family radical SAM enzyme